MKHSKKKSVKPLLICIISLTLFSFADSSNAGWLSKLKHFLPPTPGIDIEAALDGDICGGNIACSGPRSIYNNCIKNEDDSACATSIIAPNFNSDCRRVGNAYSTFAYVLVNEHYEDLVTSNNLDAAIKDIFEVRLNSPGFLSYVHSHVNYFQSTGITNAGKTTYTDIYFQARPSKSLIIHELFHVFQYYKNTVYSFETSFCDDVANKGRLYLTYFYTLDPNLNLFTFGPEQQAEIVQTYYRIKYEGKRNCDSDGVVDFFQNCSNYANRFDLAQNDFETIIRPKSKVTDWLIPVLGILNK